MAEKRRKTVAKTVAPKRVVQGATREEQITARDQQIAERAYERFAARGFVHGHDMEDWLAAEAEI